MSILILDSRSRVCLHEIVAIGVHGKGHNAVTAVRWVLAIATVVLAAVATSILIAGLPESPGTGGSPSPSAATGDPTAMQSLPGPTVGTWETPPLDATAPAGALAIPGIGMTELADILAAAGYSCESFKASTDLLADAYVLSCTSEEGDATARVDTIYWTQDHVMTIHAAVSPVTPGDEITDMVAAEGLLKPLLNIPYNGSNDTATEAWFADQSANAACKESYCRQDFGEVRYELEIGSGGAMQLHIEGLAAKP